MDQFIEVPESVLACDLIEFGCVHSYFSVVLGIFSSVLLLSKDGLQVKILIFQLLQLLLHYLHLMYGCLVEVILHFLVKVDPLPFVVFELEPSPVDGLLCVHDLFSQLFGPLGQQSQNGRVADFEVGGLYIFLREERDSDGYFLPNLNLFLEIFDPGELRPVVVVHLNSTHILNQILESLINFVLLFVDDPSNLIGDSFRGHVDGVLEDELEYFRKHFVVAVLQFHVGVVHLVGEGDEFVDNFHDIFGVVSVLPVVDVDVVAEEEVEVVALPVVDDWHLGLDPLADALAPGLGVLFGYVVEYPKTLLVDELHQVVSYFKRKFLIVLEHFLYVLQDVLRHETFCLLLSKGLFFEVVIAN